MDNSLAFIVRTPENLNPDRPKTDAAPSIEGEVATVFPGQRLFQLRATHGLPIGDALSRIVESGLAVGWTGFMTEARANGWYDYQSLDAIEQAWIDADLDREQLEQIMLRLKMWIVKNPIVGN